MLSLFLLIKYPGCCSQQKYHYVILSGFLLGTNTLGKCPSNWLYVCEICLFFIDLTKVPPSRDVHNLWKGVCFVQNSEADMTFEHSNASMVSGLVDYMPTLVSAGGTTASDRRLSDKPPPLPPKVHRVSSVDRALPGRQPPKPVCIL